MPELGLTDLIAHAPESCGVYLWYERAGATTPLYIGKARKLRSRLRQYLHADDFKTSFLMRRAGHVEWIVTENETEALLLENNLIKKYQPPYNVRLKDDKQYPYICISVSEPFPRIYLTRRRQPGNLYFGPFSRAHVAREKIRLALELFPLRRRPLKLPLSRPAKPCLNYHLRKCHAPCAEKISREDYAKIVEQAVAFISGSDEEIRRQIQRRMEQLASELRFEEAAKLRDILAYFSERNIHPQVETHNELPDFDIVGIFSASAQNLLQELQLGENELPLIYEKIRNKEHSQTLRFAQVCLLKFRNGRLIARENFALTETDIPEQAIGDAELGESFFRDYYVGMLDLPEFIVTADGMDLSHWQKTLAKPATILQLKEFSEKLRQINQDIQPKALMEMARHNAQLALRERLLAENLRNQRIGLRQLQKFLQLKKLPEVIECYDVSNIHGAEAVASGVMLRDGMPYKPGYRKYRIKTVEGINDPAMVYEVISRRLARIRSGEITAPDLIVIDGGSTQLKAALKARSEAALSIPMIGLAKREEEIYTEDGKILRFDKDSPGMQILRRARDEAHRFALSYHRNLRMKRNLRSLFDGVAGIGEKKRSEILIWLRKLDLGELDANSLAQKLAADCKIPLAISEQLAQKIFASLERQ
ncbi:MAG: excinuclease ABC subunit UvrC [Leptospiraceae bacterium]|nr:excinuclease ABC subunit UvrC [Leptospiraceae bacterium]